MMTFFSNMGKLGRFTTRGFLLLLILLLAYSLFPHLKENLKGSEQITRVYSPVFLKLGVDKIGVTYSGWTVRTKNGIAFEREVPARFNSPNHVEFKIERDGSKYLLYMNKEDMKEMTYERYMEYVGMAVSAVLSDLSDEINKQKSWK